MDNFPENANHSRTQTTRFEPHSTFIHRFHIQHAIITYYMTHRYTSRYSIHAIVHDIHTAQRILITNIDI